MSQPIVPAPVVCLGIPKNAPVAVLIEVSNTVVNTMAANKATFSSPSPALTTVSAAITTLGSAQTAFKSHAGTKGARDDAWTNLIQLMQQLRAYVQTVASATPAQASHIATRRGDAAPQVPHASKERPLRQRGRFRVGEDRGQGAEGRQGERVPVLHRRRQDLDRALPRRPRPTPPSPVFSRA